MTSTPYPNPPQNGPIINSGDRESTVTTAQKINFNMASNDMQGSHPQYNGDLIEQLLQVSRTKASGCLQLSTSEVSWELHFYHGTITYASDNISAWDRLERLLRFLGCQPLPQVVDSHARSPHSFCDNLDQLTEIDSSQQAINWLLQQLYIGSAQSATLLQDWMQPDKEWSFDPSYQAVHWLVTEGVLTQEHAVNLLELTIREVLELMLVCQNYDSIFLPKDRLSGLPRHGSFAIEPLIDTCLQRLKRWQTLSPHIWSPYQRPYFFSQSDAAQQLLPELKQRLGSMLRGFSFRHLGAALRKDEFLLAQSLQAYVQQGCVFLREPQEPFHHLPQIASPQDIALPESIEAWIASTRPSAMPVPAETSEPEPPQLNFGQPSERFKIACVDDSLAMLNEITRLLNNEQFSVTAINNPVRALMQIVRVQPNLVLLDVGMPGMDGYELCRLLRNHPLFEKTPVIMVTGHTGIIDRARAKLVGATDYLTKPFTQEGLLKVVTKHLLASV